MNRRIRFRTYGGVRGRGPKGPLLLDYPEDDLFNRESFHASRNFLRLSYIEYILDKAQSKKFGPDCPDSFNSIEKTYENISENLFFIEPYYAFPSRCGHLCRHRKN